MAALLGAHASSIETSRRQYVERAASPWAYRDFFLETFAPAVAIREGLADEPARAQAFGDELLDFAARFNRGVPGGPAEYPYEYLLVVARR